MLKAEIKALLLGDAATPSPSLSPFPSNSPSLSSSPSGCTSALPSLSAALSHYKDSLAKVREAEGRQRVLARQLQKQKSTTLNAQRHSDYADYVRQTADLDKYLQQWNSAARARRLHEQSLLNRQSKSRIRNNIDNSRSFFHADNAHRGQSLKQESELHELCIRDTQQELANSHIKQRRASQKQEKKRQQLIANFHEHKQQQVRREKSREIRKYCSHSVSNHGTINQLVERNHSLKNRRYREEAAARKLNYEQLPINLASTIKNPEVYGQ